MKFMKVKRAVRAVCFLLIFSFVFHSVSKLLERKGSAIQFSEFWSDPTGYDVLFFGTSHMYHAVFPMELWEENGIRSYSLASCGSLPVQMYWTLVNALDYAKPKVVVIDCYNVQRETKMLPPEEIEGLVHTGFDAVPLSVNKVRAFMDMFDTMEERLEYLCNFSIYHNRWEEIGQKDFEPEYNVQKGTKIYMTIRDQSGYSIIAESDMIEEETIGYFYVRKMIELCQENDIAVVLTAIPVCSGDTVQRALNGIAKLSEEYNVPFLNMHYDDALQIDYQTDFWDQGHLSLNGQRKSSEYLGNYLVENFGFSKNNLKENERKAWEEDYLAYAEQKISWLREGKKLIRYLMWLGDAGFACEIYQEKEADDESTVGKLLAHIPNRQMISKEEAVAEFGEELTGNYAFIVKNAETGEIIDKAVFKKGKRV